MPNVDESQQDRQTFGGDPQGWSEGQRVATDAPVAPAGAPETSPPPPDAPTAPSAEQAPQDPASEQAPPPTSQPEPETYNAPPKERWDEVIQQRKDAERQRDEALRLAQSAVERGQPQSVAAPSKDPWEGKINNPDPVVAQQWQEIKVLMDQSEQRGAERAVKELMPTIQAGMEKFAQQDLRIFRKDNPEIKPGSEDENAIVAYMNGQVDNTRHSIESAKRNVLFDRLEAENRALKAKQAAVPQKRAANTEPTSGIPATAGLPSNQGGWKDRAGQVLDTGGGTLEAAKEAFR